MSRTNQTKYYVKTFIELCVGSYILHPLLSSLFKLLNNGSKSTEFVYPKLIAFIIESKGCNITKLVAQLVRPSVFGPLLFETLQVRAPD